MNTCRSMTCPIYTVESLSVNTICNVYIYTAQKNKLLLNLRGNGNIQKLTAIKTIAMLFIAKKSLKDQRSSYKGCQMLKEET